MNDSDLRYYATVSESDHSLQYISTVCVTIVATPINFLSFYLILTKSKRERTSFKMCLFASQFTFYVSQLFVGVLAGIVTLMPFPAIYCQGILSSYFDAFQLFMAWMLLFCFYVYLTFATLLLRLQIVARPKHAFDCHKSTYVVAYIILAIYVLTPVPSMIALSYSSREHMEQFVLQV
uniref:Uncharacterized protein n=1 Tax=Caenorhabditis japonica TaxID=281687 RepID=A0A8R1HFK2_CAEJA